MFNTIVWRFCRILTQIFSFNGENDNKMLHFLNLFPILVNALLLPCTDNSV
ncbi:hypothetical protein P3J6_120069 [Pseudoalteromonas sp. 3J6]|nr:hypothetical protein PUND_a2602 [Pseudoalteromonas undina]CAD2224241.1 hypothetical protein P3J6_120069 [Pseudoalteromonas sp. 3J6]